MKNHTTSLMRGKEDKTIQPRGARWNLFIKTNEYCTPFVSNSKKIGWPFSPDGEIKVLRFVADG